MEENMTAQIITNYKNDPHLRESFFSLSKLTFGINFTDWFNLGYWTDAYQCFSIVEDNKIVANVSASLLDLVIDHKSYKAIQIGTVMTHPDYRGRGYARQLLDEVIEHYEQQTDFIYLFANDKVLDFYTKFGFSERQQSTYKVHASNISQTPSQLQKLSMDSEKDRLLLFDFATNRVPISQAFGTQNSAGLLMFYAIVALRNEIYYDQDKKVIYIVQEQGPVMTVYDILTKQPRPLSELLATINSETLQQFDLFFTPDHDIPFDKGVNLDDGTLFVKCRDGIEFPNKLRHPFTSIA